MMKLDPYLTSYTNINSKRIKTQNVWVKPIKLLEEKLGVDLHVLYFGNGYLDMTPKAQATKEK